MATVQLGLWPLPTFADIARTEPLIATVKTRPVSPREERYLKALQTRLTALQKAFPAKPAAKT